MESAGILIGIGLCALLARALPGTFGIPLMLIAPIGASAVLIFALPNSPLAQPWSAIVGNVVSAAIAIVVLKTVPATAAPAIAVGGAALAMFLTRSLHPPGGAVALLATLDHKTVLEAGYWFALVPVGLMTVTLVISGILYNQLTGRHYPFRQQVRREESQEPQSRLGLSNDEISALLQRFNQSPNIGAADLGRLLASAEREAAGHRFDGVTCAEIMSGNLIFASPEDSITSVARKFRKHAIKSLPVLDGSDKFLGVILQIDIIDGLMTSRFPSRRKQHSLTAYDVRRPPGNAVAPETPVGHLLNRLAVQSVEFVPVTRGKTPVGIITRSDIVNLLLAGSLQRQAA
ncbi:HPP family protein [Roseovarius sp. CAU 1744]|uniref:HPP family protein n=1 Tax=Roseovarius sp. CAU 1744 TaxID=3140368 RepID=UPI00325B9233